MHDVDLLPMYVQVIVVTFSTSRVVVHCSRVCLKRHTWKEALFFFHCCMQARVQLTLQPRQHLAGITCAAVCSRVVERSLACPSHCHVFVCFFAYAPRALFVVLLRFAFLLCCIFRVMLVRGPTTDSVAVLFLSIGEGATGMKFCPTGYHQIGWPCILPARNYTPCQCFHPPPRLFFHRPFPAFLLLLPCCL